MKILTCIQILDVSRINLSPIDRKLAAKEASYLERLISFLIV